jgi:phage tail sheath gpL-like
MPLTNIANRLTPSTPIEITFGQQPVATGRKIASLIGHRAAAGGTGTTYSVYEVANVGDPTAAKTEVDAIAGTGSELGKMAEAFVKANSIPGRSNFPPFRIVLLANADADYGPADEALEALKPLRSDLIVSPYDAQPTALLRTKLTDLCALISGPDRDANGQFGSTAVMASIVASASALAINADNKYLTIPYLQDTSVVKSQPAAIVASCIAAIMLGSVFPYLPLMDQEAGGLIPPALKSDYILSGSTELSELALVAGLAPLKVDAAGRVRMIRSRLTKVTTDGITPATAYFDWQDMQVLYDFRESVFLRLQQPDLKPKKASITTAKLIKDEILRIAKSFEEAEAFQSVNALAPQFIVQPSASSRGRFDFKIPVNVLPGLQVVAGNIEASTQFDAFTV